MLSVNIGEAFQTQDSRLVTADYSLLQKIQNDGGVDLLNLNSEDIEKLFQLSKFTPNHSNSSL